MQRRRRGHLVGRYKRKPESAVRYNKYRVVEIPFRQPRLDDLRLILSGFKVGAWEMNQLLEIPSLESKFERWIETIADPDIIEKHWVDCTRNLQDELAESLEWCTQWKGREKCCYTPDSTKIVHIRHVQGTREKAMNEGEKHLESLVIETRRSMVCDEDITNVA
jgi:hypothetical protein